MPAHTAPHDQTLDSVPGEEAAVGRHTAPDDDARDPVVAAALAGRAADNAGAHRDDGAEEYATQRIGGNVGWPGEPPGPGGGLGWPGDLAPDRGADTARNGTPADVSGTGPSGADDVSEEPSLEPAGRRRGWRRLLGLDRAA
jgi:hypothetical protein